MARNDLLAIYDEEIEAVVKSNSANHEFVASGNRTMVADFAASLILRVEVPLAAGVVGSNNRVSVPPLSDNGFLPTNASLISPLSQPTNSHTTTRL